MLRSADVPVTSDLSYSLDGIGTDAFADVMLGRIPANTLTSPRRPSTRSSPTRPSCRLRQATTSTTTPRSPRTSRGSGPSDQRGFTLSAEKMRAGLRSRGHVVTPAEQRAQHRDIQGFKDGTAIPDELKRPATPWTDSREQVVSELNAGRFLFVHRDHGSRLGWANPSFGINDIASLNNGTKLPLVLAINCASGGFQFPGSEHQRAAAPAAGRRRRGVSATRTTARPCRTTSSRSAGPTRCSPPP